MKWQFAIKRALETAVWAFVPVATLGFHHAVRLKYLFIQQHQLGLANIDDRYLRAGNIWKLGEQRYGLLCLAAVLIPVLCCFIQHLGLRWWWRALIGSAICAPALWYAGVVLYLYGKLTAPAH